ncbi:MAG: sulfatase [Candidatus Hydrogenedentota bacterium]
MLRRWRVSLAAALLIFGALESARAAPRNIVFILVDDMRYDALGVLNLFFETPHLDALAKNGTLFKNSFVTTSLCSPSRASILTGQWAHTHRVLDNSTPLDPATPIFPSLLQGAGYETAFIGKWHMGGETDAPRPGFDRWVSFRGQGLYTNQTFNVDGKQTQTTGYNPDQITSFAVEFLERQHEKPFFLYVSHKAVHADFVPAERHLGSYEGKTWPRPGTMADTEENYRGKPDWVRKQRNSWHGVDGLYNKTVDFDVFVRKYAETLRAVDDSVGKIVAALKGQGLLDSTLLVFTSDNGFQFGEHGLIDKRTMYEASIRTPLIVHCPELLPAGNSRDEMVLNVDFGPTFLEAAGVAVPPTMQGRSFFGMLNGTRAAWRDAFVYTYFWERAFPQTPTVLGLRTDRYKLMRYHGIFDRYELYDLEQDPGETNNLVGEFYTTTQAGNVEQRILGTDVPPETKALFRELDARLNKELDALGCSREPNWSPLAGR